MKLVEALSIRTQLVNKVGQLFTRLSDSVKVQEGDEPVEMPHEVLAELDTTLTELQRMIYAINTTNTLTIDESGRNITSLLAERDTLKQRADILKAAVDILGRRDCRYNHNEIRYIRTVDVAEFRTIYNECAARLRKLDLHIQGLGFTTDLIEE